MKTEQMRMGIQFRMESANYAAQIALKGIRDEMDKITLAIDAAYIARAASELAAAQATLKALNEQLRMLDALEEA